MADDAGADAGTQWHVWVGAATVGLSDQQARWAVLRHSVRIPVQESFKIPILEVYCAECRRPYDDVADEPCVAADKRAHLIGGPIGTRKKRSHAHNCELLGCNDDGRADTG
ncbi:hypothetical protein [Actinomadura violacea]|uniref:Uncharacterized protein n=1 Tax=Actinomadura violacea TaxID=2819934 RepID=A0ABS3RY67_9ACTN|nr:hypothetical protein [Actinomadura violacea]MBO2461704.1 hypothetical protein [Actinomadura violacea]